MLVKLTESGLRVFGVGGDQAVKNVNNARAYHLMVNGHANTDRRFMSMHERNNPKPKKVAKEKAKPELKPVAKEKATSKRAAARETAVKK